MSNNCPVTRSRSSVLSDNFWKSGYPNLILSGFGRDRNLAVMLDLSSSRPPASYWRGRTGQCWGWEPEVAGESGKSFISQQLVTCWNFLQFLEENEIIDSRISSNVGCQDVRDVEHHSEHAKSLEMLQLLVLENDFDLRLRFQLGFLHLLHFLLYWPPPLNWNFGSYWPPFLLHVFILCWNW